MYIQLWHLGRANHPDAPEQRASGQPVYAPSAISARGGKFRFIEGVPGYVTPTEVEDPQTLIELFRKGAVNAKEAGFDGAEVHGANGYLIAQFLDSTANKRTDKWGGSVENRARFALETMKVVSDVFGPDRVGLRISPCGGYNDVGMPLQETKDTFSYLISEAEKLKAAYIAIIRYAEMFDVKFDDKLRGTPHDVVEVYGPLIKNAKFFLNMGLTAEEAASLIEAGKIDGAVFGRDWITNPDLAHRIRDGKPLNNAIDYATLYGHGGTQEEERKGYVDYPFAE
jgi:2,4-dienoyl-CoA reductase-like NADH-dependent reductase (Old Yellow Enzyme family)